MCQQQVVYEIFSFSRVARGGGVMLKLKKCGIPPSVEYKDDISLFNPS
jgi:hypothetical protein